MTAGERKEMLVTPDTDCVDGIDKAAVLGTVSNAIGRYWCGAPGHDIGEYAVW